jgi:hypothetical protein
MAQFTSTQQKIMDILEDGFPHKFEELREVLPDKLGGRRALGNHLNAIRAKIRPGGREILCQFLLRQRQYRMVRMLHSPNTGCY